MRAACRQPEVTQESFQDGFGRLYDARHSHSLLFSLSPALPLVQVLPELSAPTPSVGRPRFSECSFVWGTGGSSVSNTKTTLNAAPKTRAPASRVEWRSESLTPNVVSRHIPLFHSNSHSHTRTSDAAATATSAFLLVELSRDGDGNKALGDLLRGAGRARGRSGRRDATVQSGTSLFTFSSSLWFRHAATASRGCRHGGGSTSIINPLKFEIQVAMLRLIGRAPVFTQMKFKERVYKFTAKAPILPPSLFRDRYIHIYH